MGRLLALLMALLAAGVLAWAEQRAPRPKPVDAPAGEFSAGRAIADVAVIAARPHPMGSPANRAVRDHLLRRMTALGLAPQVRRGAGLAHEVGPTRTVIYGGFVENIVGVLPGRDRGAPALALMAHYDSVPGSPGAADDAAGVGSALEVIRAIRVQGAPARDVIVLITDGEESGLLGANAFFRRDPMARRIGFVLNMEARGAAGRVHMFQTGARAAGTVALLQRTAVRPSASSLISYVHAQMPNDTDFTESRKAGIGGMNYAFLGRQFEYHSPTSTPATLDPGTLQDMGQQVLAAARAAAFDRSLPAPGPDRVYGQTPGAITLAYPPGAGWLILLASALLIGWAAIRARAIEAFAWTDVARGAGAALFAILGAASLLHFARLVTGAPFGFIEQRFLLAQVVRWETAAFLLALGFLIFAAATLARGRRVVAVVPLLAAIGSCAIGGLDWWSLGVGAAASLLALATYGRPVSRAGGWIGVLLVGLVGAIALQVAAPLTAFIVAWPLALGSVAAAATAASARKGGTALAVMGVLAALGLGWIGGLAHLAFQSLDIVEVLAGPVLLAALLIWPLAQPEEGAPPARLVGPLMIVAGLGVLLAVRFGHPYDARHPQVGSVVYQVEQDAGRAWLVDTSPEPTAWTRSALAAGGGAVTRLSHWSLGGPRTAAPAPFVEEASPALTLSRLPDGRVSLRVTPPPGARTIRLRLTPDTPATVEAVGGVSERIPLKPGRPNGLQWEAAPEGFDVVLRPAGPGRLDVGYAATFERWPANVSLPPRPADVTPFGSSDSIVVTGARRFAW